MPFLAIDLKSFYASVECVERRLDPLRTHLVVADASRTDKTICLAVSPSLKAYGIGGRARLFEVNQRLCGINDERLRRLPVQRFTGHSYLPDELAVHPDWKVEYIAAPPRMAHYIEFSSRIYNIYLRYIAPEDIHIYSIDEVFIDTAPYLTTYRMTTRQLASRIIQDIFSETGITATAGIGTNLYLCKVAMDIVAKHTVPDADGVCIAELDEMTYRQQLWDHQPLTDFWRVGRGIARRLAPYGINTMGKLARFSLQYEDLLYNLFGVNAELLIDHVWGWEPCTMEAIKAYHPDSHSFSSGQVLATPYDAEKALVVVREMADGMALKLVRKGLVTDHLTLSIGYDVTNLTDPARRAAYTGKITTDHYGRQVPARAHGSARLDFPTSSARAIMSTAAALFNKIVNPTLLIRYLNLSTGPLMVRDAAPPAQLSLFDTASSKPARPVLDLEKEHRMQEAVLRIKEKFGKNAILRGLNFEEGATARERNNQIGGHKA